MLLFKQFAPSIFASNFYILGFALTAFILVLAQYFSRQKQTGNITYKSSIIIGVAQGLACLPGVSRSGSTICAGLFCGEEKQEVARFSFLLSIPIIIASCAYELIFDYSSTQIDVLPLVVGLFCAFLSGIIAIKCMLKVIQKSKLSYFAIYLFAISILLTFYYFYR